MTRKIFQSIIAVVISVLLLSLALITGVLYNHFETAMLDQLRTTAQFAEALCGRRSVGTSFWKIGVHHAAFYHPT